jgi:hypothetical protein
MADSLLPVLRQTTDHLRPVIRGLWWDTRKLAMPVTARRTRGRSGTDMRVHRVLRLARSRDGRFSDPVRIGHRYSNEPRHVTLKCVNEASLIADLSQKGLQPIPRSDGKMRTIRRVLWLDPAQVLTRAFGDCEVAVRTQLRTVRGRPSAAGDGGSTAGMAKRRARTGITQRGLDDILEKEWQHTVTDLAKKLGWLSYHTFNSRRSAHGFPDLVLLRDRVIFLELKRENRKTSKLTVEQQVWVRWLINAGAEVYVVRPSHLQALADVLAARAPFSPPLLGEDLDAELGEAA